MNVNFIHNKEFHDRLPPTYLEQARALANWHEYGVFSSAQVDGIGNSPYDLPRSYLWEVLIWGLSQLLDARSSLQYSPA